MRMPMNGGSVPSAQARGDLAAPRCGVAVLLVVRAVAVAVLEVDAEVLDRLALQLLDDARVDRSARAAIEAERRGERRRVRRVLVERAQRERAELLRRVGLNRCAPP